MKKKLIRTAFITLATIISGTMIAMASTCPTCSQVDGQINQTPTQTLDCQFNSSLMLCDDSDPLTSELECFTNPTATVVSGKLFELLGGVWVQVGTCTFSAKECWHDDTGCGGNG